MVYCRRWGGGKASVFLVWNLACFSASSPPEPSRLLIALPCIRSVDFNRVLRIPARPRFEFSIFMRCSLALGLRALTQVLDSCSPLVCPALWASLVHFALDRRSTSTSCRVSLSRPPWRSAGLVRSFSRRTQSRLTPSRTPHSRHSFYTTNPILYCKTGLL